MQHTMRKFHLRIVFHLWGVKLDEGHAGGAPVRVHDEADAVGLDAEADKELAQVLWGGLEGDALKNKHTPGGRWRSDSCAWRQ